MTTADAMLFEIETETGVQRVSVDLSSDLGEITPDEHRLLIRYVVLSGIEDIDQAWAGAHVLLKLYRQIDVEPDALVAAVI